jgi:hypothetical protein
MRLPSIEKMLAEVQDIVQNPILLTSPDQVEAQMNIPDAWREMLRRQETGAKSWVEPWQAYQNLLPGVYDFLQHKVRGVCLLLENAKPPSLLYVYSQGEDIDFHRGLPALGSNVPNSKRHIWERLPLDLQNFYSQVHNGWIYLPADSLGPLPVQDIKFLSDYEWDTEPDELKKLPFPLDQVITVFSNGGGDYLCLDLSHGAAASEDHALSWWHEEPLEPHLNFNFWALLDGWICGQMEDVDLAD